MDDYLLSPAETTAVTDAYRRVVRQCMSTFGHDFPPVAGQGKALLRSWNERRYGLADLDRARSSGYRLEQPGRTAAYKPPTPEERTVLTGDKERSPDGREIPKGGCAGQARDRLYGASHADQGLAQSLSDEGFHSSAGDARVRSAVARWSLCMRGHGFAYPGPLDPPKDPRFQGGAPSELERTVAATDVRCKSEGHLVEVWSSVEAARQTELIGRHRSGLAAAARAKRALLERAARLQGPPR
ncbi:hypothetical protein AGRA3207_004462 [Actinomadura graeca]|uniref:Uncharacterized protein n=1 Tax=Actinomadura graeca TaxID=2750812 RepID=A0ABX8QYA3_9ACTN|nr:hypothetical protein [Actinomadura graeca]QXJ23321.1 hypothetical protein AGRA3207_004462 [Actinomadura graeca]